MAGHPQGSNRGLKVMAVAAPTSLTITNSTATVVIGTNSTGLTLSSTGSGIKLGSAAAMQIKGNTTAITLAGGLRLSGKTTAQLTGNTTGVIATNQLRVGSKTTYLSSNSTGVKLGAKYITGNTTAN